MLIDEFAPQYDVASRHAITVRAPAEVVFRAVRAANLAGSSLTRLLLSLRGLSARNGRPGTVPALTFDDVLQYGFVVLGERPGREVVLGTVGRFWERRPATLAVDPDAFRDFAEPGFAKAALTISIEPLPDGTSRLTTETRVTCPDAGTRRRFRLYWLAVAPFSGAIRRHMLRAIKAKAEHLATYRLVAGAGAPPAVLRRPPAGFSPFAAASDPAGRAAAEPAVDWDDLSLEDAAADGAAPLEARAAAGGGPRVTPLNHRWDVTPRQAIELQRHLRSRLVPQPPPNFAPRYVAGADISMSKGSDVAYAGIVVIDALTMETVEEATAVATLTFPYVPGLLSFRELPPVAEAWARLRRKPDVVIFDGAGYAHPRRFGLACHGGVLFDTPSIGCAKTILVGHHDHLGEERGATAPLVDKGEVVGMAVRLRDGVRPVYVSVGHLVDLETAVHIVLGVSAGYREPETTRRAHALVNRARKTAGAPPPAAADAAEGEGPGGEG